MKQYSEDKDQEYREHNPFTSDERHKEILEASSQVTLDDYNPDARWTFADGECPFGWYDAQVKAMNHFGHIFCINPFYDNLKKFGWEYKSTNDMLDRLTGPYRDYLDMTIRTIKYLKAQCGVEFPNGWGDQFIKAV
jgi:hypothetical protein